MLFLQIVVFDPSDTVSFESVSERIECMRENTNDDIVCVIVSNKNDLTNKFITHEMTQVLCNKYNITLKTCSAATGDGVNELFQFVVDEFCQNVDLINGMIQQQVQYQRDIDLHKQTFNNSICNVI
ncbi:hypothetical protein EIN_524360 [Entamoeba invadens IP1]|uniref:Uncharacterized protein n=1 Tax=Entamoeba invadens IP1 TaxID=370355 RepID=A0A0A1UGB6_ENTIV|nr:hypothetical protein EIN_524360 [Entamoeba invadens IP1]ELP92498.1 hypothetical protein EIN_524360 [Entamoeba invadens IP1]|eukprot:XP_004259269.1 hypothetical protein EIN_524360 [Entamoeba invadens IP1]